MMKLNILLACAKSMIYFINNRGSRIEPCGMPVVTGNRFDFISSIPVYSLRLFM